MDDHPTPVLVSVSMSGGLIVSRRGEVTRFQRQFWAQAYERLCPQVRRPLADMPAQVRPTCSTPRHSTAARVAAGA